MTIRRAFREPVNTYRLQLNGGFRFADARALVPYLDALGVTDCYSSPQLKATPGSMHGYDISDHRALNPELGGDIDHDAFAGELRAHRLGEILDFVPNHMSTDPESNPWWRDVLENGPSSPFAEFFDIDWHPIKPELEGKVLLPVLGDHYGRVLERGELRLVFEAGQLSVRYFTLRLPINPRQAPRVLGLDLERLESERRGDPELREYLSVLTALQNLPLYTERDPDRIVERHREKEVTRDRLARLVSEHPAFLSHVEDCVRRANGSVGDRSSFDLLHDLLENQAYRLAYWRTAIHEINYRRFFDINELVALRMEDPRVFEATHALLKSLIARGIVTGVRIDHPDGLFDPEQYFERLQQLAREARAGLDADVPLYVAAEKIVSEGETLPADWPVCGETGYSFLNLASGLFLDPRGLKPLRRMYRRLTGLTDRFQELAYECKRTIMLTSMASELNLLAHALNRITESDRRWRDFTLESCRKVLLEVIACFRVYRTYVSGRGISGFDRAAVGAAIADARRRNPLMEASIFTFLERILLSEPAGAASELEPAERHENAGERLRFAMQFQQFTGPVQAKGVEDTAFYRYHVLVSANDVGGHPQRPEVSPEAFHAANLARLDQRPLEMLATSTHDAKRGEDARMRLSAISEIPDQWRRAVSEWMRINGPNRTKIEGLWAPDRNDEYLFYQSLVAVWPFQGETAAAPDRAPDELVARLRAYMEKAVREAKLHTSWVNENPAYSDAVARFVDKSLQGRTTPRFLASLMPLQRRLACLGAVNALAQLVLKLASPGVADFYQGTELWQLDLVDPDNRRPIDYALRRELLEMLRPLADRIESGGTAAQEVGELVRRFDSGAIKLFVTTCGLRLRRRHPELMCRGRYAALTAEGAAADRLVAFARYR